MEIQLERIETALTLLEARLASIPALASVSSTSQIPVSSAAAAGIQSGIVTNDVTVTPEITRTEPLPVATKIEMPIVPLVNGLVINDSAPGVLRIRDDPEYAKYFKMLKMGVIMPAVKQKMAGEGLDPNLLETPDAPSPNASVNCNSTAVTAEKPIAAAAIPVPAVRTSVADQKAVNGPSVGKNHGRTEEEEDGGDSDSAASSFSSDG